MLRIPGPLHNVVSQDTRGFERMLDLHGCVDSGASVGVELFACFAAGGEEDFVVIYFLSVWALVIIVSDGMGVGWWTGRTFEGYTGGAEDLAVGGDGGDGGCCHFDYLFGLVLV